MTRKPFRAAPVTPSSRYLDQRRRRRRRLKAAGVLATVAVAVFAGGMVATNWPTVRSAFSGGPADTVYFSECGMVRRNCVVDGDTFWMGGRKIRIADIDTPEIREPQCQSEYDRGMMAKRRLRELLNAGPIELDPIPDRDKDRYGRELRVVMRAGYSLGDQLVSEGLARTWTGRREPWC